MQIFKLIVSLLAVATLATAASAQTATVVLSAGTSCGGATSATYTTGGPAVPVSICANVNPATLFACGHTLQLKSASAAEASAFTVTSRTTGAAFATYAETLSPFAAQAITLTGTADLGAVYTAGTAVSGGANILLATVNLTPAAATANASYVISFNANSDLITNTNANCTAGLVDNTPLTGTFTLNKAILTAPTASLPATASLTGGAFSVPFTVTSGSGTLGLVCSITSATNAAAAIAISSGGTQTINAGATTATPVGLTCTPQAFGAPVATATLSCAQTPNPSAVLAPLTSTITCPQLAAASITYTGTPTTLTFTGVTSGTPTATQAVNVQAAAANTAALNLSSCVIGGANPADFSFFPAPAFPVSVAAGASSALQIRFTPPAANSLPRVATLICQTPNATTAGATSFSVTLNGTNPAPVPIAIAPTTPGGNVVLPTFTIGSTPAFVTTALNFSVTGGSGVLTCAVSGAGYTVTGSPLNLVPGTAGTVTVTYTGATVGTFAGSLTCTPTAPATGAVTYNLSTTVQAAPAIGPTVQVPTMGAFGLGLLGLLIAGFAGLVQRRQVR